MSKKKTTVTQVQNINIGGALVPIVTPQQIDTSNMTEKQSWIIFWILTIGFLIALIVSLTVIGLVLFS